MAWARAQPQKTRRPGPWHAWALLGLRPGPVAHDVGPMSYGLVLWPTTLS